MRIQKVSFKEIKFLRQLYLQENNFQIRYNSCHERNWSDSYLLIFDEQIVGYGSIKGKNKLEERDSIFEFYVLPPYRKHSRKLFSDLITVSKTTNIECQTNDKFFSDLVYEFSKNINSEVVLFEDDKLTNYKPISVRFRKRKLNEVVFNKKEEDIGTYVLEKEKKIIATGDFLLHYNLPFADLFMEVVTTERNRGFGTYILQELKRECYLIGRKPAARCNISNIASKNTLLKAGFKIVGYMLEGEVK